MKSITCRASCCFNIIGKYFWGKGWNIRNCLSSWKSEEFHVCSQTWTVVIICKLAPIIKFHRAMFYSSFLMSAAEALRQIQAKFMRGGSYKLVYERKMKISNDIFTSFTLLRTIFCHKISSINVNHFSTLYYFIKKILIKYYWWCDKFEWNNSILHRDENFTDESFELSFIIVCCFYQFSKSSAFSSLFSCMNKFSI